MIVISNYSNIEYMPYTIALQLNCKATWLNSESIKEYRMLFKLQKLTNAPLFKMNKADNAIGFMWEKIR